MELEGQSPGTITGPLNELVAGASADQVKKAGTVHVKEAAPSTVQKMPQGIGQWTWLSHLGAAGATVASSPYLVVARGSSGEAGRLRVTMGKLETKFSHLLLTSWKIGRERSAPRGPGLSCGLQVLFHL